MRYRRPKDEPIDDELFFRAFEARVAGTLKRMPHGSWVGPACDERLAILVERHLGVACPQSGAEPSAVAQFVRALAGALKGQGRLHAWTHALSGAVTLRYRRAWWRVGAAVLKLRGGHDFEEYAVEWGRGCELNNYWNREDPERRAKAAVRSAFDSPPTALTYALLHQRGLGGAAKHWQARGGLAQLCLDVWPGRVVQTERAKDHWQVERNVREEVLRVARDVLGR